MSLEVGQTAAMTFRAARTAGPPLIAAVDLAHTGTFNMNESAVWAGVAGGQVLNTSDGAGPANALAAEAAWRCCPARACNRKP